MCLGLHELSQEERKEEQSKPQWSDRECSRFLQVTASRMQQTVRAGVTSGFIHIVADTLAQTVESKGDLAAHYDPKRTLTFGVVGATLHGPYFQRAFAVLDKRFAADAVLKKTAVTQFLINPPCASLAPDSRVPNGRLLPLLLCATHAQTPCIARFAHLPARP